MNNLSTNALIFDIGGRTVDIALIEMINNKPTLIKSDTWYKGMLVLYSTIIESINKKFQLTLETRYAEQILLNGLYLYGQKQDISFLQPIIQEYLDDIFTQIKLNYPYAITPTFLTGGGASLQSYLNR